MQSSRRGHSVLDLSGSESDILGKMKQKTRYNIRLAMKKGVIVKPSADLDAFYHLMEVTSQRDRFGVHQPGYYRHDLRVVPSQRAMRAAHRRV